MIVGRNLPPFLYSLKHPCQHRYFMVNATMAGIAVPGCGHLLSTGSLFVHRATLVH